jgi:hypothetical protein
MIGDVIQFPTSGTKKIDDADTLNNLAPDSIEEVDNRIDVIRQYHVNETVQTMVEIVFHNLMIAGFNVNTTDQNIHKDIFLFVESMKSLLLKTYDSDHPLQSVAEIVFVKAEDGTFKLTIPEVVNNDNL